MENLMDTDTLELEYEEYMDDNHCWLRRRTMTVSEFEEQLRLRLACFSCYRDKSGKVERTYLKLVSDERVGNKHMFKSIKSRRGYEFLAARGLPKHVSRELEEAVNAAERWRQDPSVILA